MRTYARRVIIPRYWFLELRQTVISARYLRAEAEESIDDITIGRVRLLGLPIQVINTKIRYIECYEISSIIDFMIQTNFIRIVCIA
jgi:hypothetical protein